MNSKAAFIVDSDFPDIDASGHPDKIGYFNVKGGGSTNTTLFDAPATSQDHVTYCVDSAVSTSLSTSLVDPTDDLNGGTNPGCLNAIYSGDGGGGRSSDVVRLCRVQVNGNVVRGAGVVCYSGNASNSDYPLLNVFPPRCFVALVADMACNGGTLNPELPFRPGGANVGGVGLHKSSVPFFTYQNYLGRFRVLAYDILEFNSDVCRTEVPVLWTENSAVPPSYELDTVRVTYSWPAVTKGFRFDVDLNDCMCRFSDTGVEGKVSSVSDVALHVVCLNFDGSNVEPYVPGSFGYLYANYRSVVSFEDTSFVDFSAPAVSADGPVVPDEPNDSLALLADESSKLGGLPAVKERRPKKPRRGSAPFRPKSSAGDLFPEDPEIARMRFPEDPVYARLADPGTHGDDFARPQKYWRTGDYVKMSGEPWERRPKRGKFSNE